MHTMAVTLGLIASALTTAALAKTDVVPGQLLWGGIKTGMTKAEFKALYPTHRIELSTDCVASISPSYEDRGVSAVELTYAPESTSTSCGSTMAVSLREKYGKPRTDRNYTQFISTTCSGKFQCAVRDVALALDPDPNLYWQEITWFTGDTFITLKRNRETDEWTITYFQAHLAKPEAAAKL